MFHRRTNFLLIVLCCAAAIQATAQTSSSGSNPLSGRENDPYSKFGIGELSNGNNTVLRGMGNITSAYADPYKINSDNPASLSFLKLTTFEAGAVASSRTVNTSVGGVGQSYRTGTVTLAYMSFAVPVAKLGGLSLGFRPVSKTYYSLADTVPSSVSPIGAARRLYSGEGGLNYAFIGASGHYKGLSIGVDAGFLFGTTQNTSLLSPVAYDTAFISEYSSYNRIGGLYWKGGLQYEVKLDSNYTLRIGGTLALDQNVRQHFQEYHISGFNFHDTVTRDTAYTAGDQSSTVTMPLSYSAGVMLSRNGKWSVGVDYAATKWSTFMNPANVAMQAGLAASTYKLGVGAEYSPGSIASKNYLSRGSYRIGAYYGTDYRQVNGYTMPFYGITAGASLALRRSASQIHLAADMGKLGSTDNGLIGQTYFRFTMGMSINQLWFQKSKLY